ncbi:peptidoglycan editing factor PgeF [Thiobacillus sp.]|uniref:peptidoglycan editing factor PgeF n=1 Tax=Thiobacillus sp. TaxID=924 RepID=UPI0025F5D04A|nr:peptidoglycan editing factor PgeF [Thiobacillus sp.]MBT9540340.1 peptidoglycan editing factor PgeF [Thiobacillus sp.]
MIVPDWPAPPHVKSRMTTREGGVSGAPWTAFNLGDHVGDDMAHVAANRARLRQQLPSEPGWLKQIHSAKVVEAGAGVPEADASFTRQAGSVSVVLTADCLPVLFCDRAGSVVAAAHAGWRGLADGVLEATVAAMQVPSGEILAWMGAAIGPQVFEVGDEVRQAFVARHPEAAHAFIPHAPGKWLADIYQLARIRLNHVGVQAVYGGGRCTYTETDSFFSYRRDGVTGRMASLIWLE